MSTTKSDTLLLLWDVGRGDSSNRSTQMYVSPSPTFLLLEFEYPKPQPLTPFAYLIMS